MNTAAPRVAQLQALFQQASTHHQAGRLTEAEQIYRRILQEMVERETQPLQRAAAVAQAE